MEKSPIRWIQVAASPLLLQIICNKTRHGSLAVAGASLEMQPGRSKWLRRVHGTLGVISALNLFVLITTGLLLQHARLFRLDERFVSRRVLPSHYRPQDGEEGVRADIVVADLHSGRAFGVAGALFLDGVTVAWLLLLATGLVMYFVRNGGKTKSETLA